jgi:hypothetical protein
MKVVDRIDKTKVASMEHYDQNESNGNAATKYIVKFTGKVNCEWLWKVLDEALEKSQNDEKHTLTAWRCSCGLPNTASIGICMCGKFRKDIEYKG